MFPLFGTGEEKSFCNFPKKITLIPAWRRGRKVWDAIMKHKKEAEEQEIKFKTVYLPDRYVDWLNVYLDKGKLKKVTARFETWVEENLGLIFKTENHNFIMHNVCWQPCFH